MNNPNICPFYNHVLLTLTPIQKFQVKFNFNPFKSITSRPLTQSFLNVPFEPD
jgi:hypothetical protein